MSTSADVRKSCKPSGRLMRWWRYWTNASEAPANRAADDAGKAATGALVHAGRWPDVTDRLMHGLAVFECRKPAAVRGDPQIVGDAQRDLRPKQSRSDRSAAP